MLNEIHRRLRALRAGRYGIALALILVVGLVLRVVQIGSDGLWLDEAYSVALAHMSIIDMVKATASDVHPPLYYFLLHYWVMAFGDSEIVVRLLSVVFGIAAIVMIYELGRLLFNREVGLVGALVLALSVFQIFYSQDARMYSLLVLLSLLSLYFFVLYLQRPSRLILVAYVLVTVLLLYTDVYGLFVVIVENVYLLGLFAISPAARRFLRIKEWIVLQSAIFVLFAPWIVIILRQIIVSRQRLWQLTVPSLETLQASFVAYSGSLWLLISFCALAIICIITLALAGRWKPWKRIFKLESASSAGSVVPHVLLPLWVVVIVAVPFVISQVYPMFETHSAIAASVALFLLVAAGTVSIRQRHTKVLVLVFIVLLSGAALCDYYTAPTTMTTLSWSLMDVLKPKPQIREAVQYISANAQPGDLILYFPWWHTYDVNYYQTRADLLYTPLPTPPWPLGSTPIVNATALNTAVQNHSRVWVLKSTYEPDVEKLNVTKTMSQTTPYPYHVITTQKYLGFTVYLFERD
jgi:uncharacterized membrane protein